MGWNPKKGPLREGRTLGGGRAGKGTRRQGEPGGVRHGVTRGEESRAKRDRKGRHSPRGGPSAGIKRQVSGKA